MTGEEAQQPGDFHHVGHDLSTVGLLQPDHSPDCRLPLPGGICDVHGQGVGREGSEATQGMTPWPGRGGELWRVLEGTKAGVGGRARVISFCLNWNQFQ